MVYIIAFTRAGIVLGKKIQQSNMVETVVLFGWYKYIQEDAIPFAHTKQLLEKIWKKADDIVFIGAAGIAVRSIAPFLTDKVNDPAILVMDEKGKFVIPILSGHLGGANAYAEQLARKIGAVPVITTATDCNQCFAVDLFAQKNGLWIADWHEIKEISSRILEKEPVGWISEYDVEGILPMGLIQIEEKEQIQSFHIEAGVVIASKMEPVYFPLECRLLPKNLVIGVGCRKGKSLEELEQFFVQQLEQHGFQKQQVNKIVSIDRKQQEKGLIELAKKWKIPFLTYSSDQLNAVEGDFSNSDFVKQTVGTSNVCERSAYLGSRCGKKRMKKTARDGMTMAVYEEAIAISF